MLSSSKNDDELAKPATTKGTSKVDAQQHRDNVKLLKTNVVLPLTQLGDAKVARLPQGFIKALPKGVEPSFLPTKRTE
ncbi:hypothetical protein ACFX2J_043697 [Malus domestica]